MNFKRKCDNCKTEISFDENDKGNLIHMQAFNGGFNMYLVFTCPICHYGVKIG